MKTFSVPSWLLSQINLYSFDSGKDQVDKVRDVGQAGINKDKHSDSKGGAGVSTSIP